MFRRISVICATLAILTAGRASAGTISTTTLSLDTGNVALAGYTGPFGSVQIDLQTGGTVALFTVTGATNGGFTYLLGDGGIFGFNSADSISLTNFTWTGGDGSTAIPINISNSTEDGFGFFTYSIDSFDGFTSAVSQLKFTATLLGGGTWSSAADVLDPNSLGNLVAAHIFVAGATCGGVACVTGFASGDGGGGGGGGGQEGVPEPASLVLLGSGLAFMARRARRKKAA